ncbi:hypothetical protein BJ166DRAFT_609490 [Pestalotiopsis sp. NC0098]|nr:hypothetical protein BJ166DRAFT_609490 [Pestalotiopsis sp. NC0098]
MSSPSPSLRHTRPSPAPDVLRTAKSFKRRFDLDAMEDEDRPRSPKRHNTKDYVQYNLFGSNRRSTNMPPPPLPAKRLFVDHQPQQQPVPRPSTPEPPLMRDLDDKFRNYQTVKYSDILKKLESAQEEVTAQAISQFSGPQLDSQQFSSMHNDIREPLLEVNTTLSVSSPNGTERKKDVLMSEVIADAKKRVNTATTELEQLWAD